MIIYWTVVKSRLSYVGQEVHTEEHIYVQKIICSHRAATRSVYENMSIQRPSAPQRPADGEKDSDDAI